MASAVESYHLLSRQWVMWGHRRVESGTSYGQARVRINSVPLDTIEGFWCTWNHVPAPSGLLGKGAMCRVGTMMIDGWSLFRHDVLPEWEDPANERGCSLTWTEGFDARTLDECWTHCVLAMIGETLPHSELVVGMRALSRNHKGRIEVWFASDTQPEKVEETKAAVCAIMAEQRPDAQHVCFLSNRSPPIQAAVRRGTSGRGSRPPRTMSAGVPHAGGEHPDLAPQAQQIHT